ncbi:uncharacterized mitochondrial protein-like protein [Tanacetum coccineum]
MIHVKHLGRNLCIFGEQTDDEDVGAEADLNNLETTMNVSPIPTTRIHKDHPKEQIIRDLNLATQTRRMINFFEENVMEPEKVIQDLPYSKRAIGTKWVFRNKKDERGIVFRNKARLVYVNDIIFGSTKKSLCVEFEQMTHKRFQMSSIRELTFFLGLQVQQKEDRVFISQDKYVVDILKKFDFPTVKTTSTPMEPNKALIKDEDVDVHLYKSMIRSLMYITASRPDIIYLKGQPKLGLWYPRDLSFDLEAFLDSDYAGASLDRKSTTGGCQFLGVMDSKLNA